MKILCSMMIGYFLGSLNPAAFISKIKRKNLKEFGTGNLGATNTMLSFGVKCGVFVMIFDVLKALISVRLVRILFPELRIVGILAGCMTVVGHIFPFYMNFSGGKGVASFAGIILAMEPDLLPILLLIALILMLVTNYGVAGPISASVLFPCIAGWRASSVATFLLLAMVGGLIIYKHLENLKKVKCGHEVSVSDFLKGDLSADNFEQHT